MVRGGWGRAARAAAVAWVCAAVWFPSPGLAQAAAPPGAAGLSDAPVAFDIDAQPMAAALNTWAVQANAQLFFDPALVARLTAPAIRESLGPREALRTLLAGTTLQVSEGTNGVFVIRAAATVAATPKKATPRRAPRRAAAGTPAAPAAAPAPVADDSDAGPWQIGALLEYSLDHGSAVSGASAVLSGEYSITPQLAAALAVSLPRTHSFDVAGGPAAAPYRGSARLQSTDLTLKYYFAPDARWNPYLGAGLDVTALYAASGVRGLDRVSAGPIAEAGFVVRLNRQWSIDAQVSWAQIKPGVAATGRDISLDPLQFRLGFVYR